MNDVEQDIMLPNTYDCMQKSWGCMIIHFIRMCSAYHIHNGWTWMNRLYIVWMAFYYTLLAILDHSHLVCWTYTCMHNYRVAGIDSKVKTFANFEVMCKWCVPAPRGSDWCRYLYYANVCMQIVNFQKAPTVFVVAPIPSHPHTKNQLCWSGELRLTSQYDSLFRTS